MDTEKIKTIIADTSISDETVRKEIEKIDPSSVSSEEITDILSFLEEKRAELHRIWKLEVASSYM
jgi:hypothetical protein